MFVFITVSYLQNNIIKDYHSKALNRFLALLICENVYGICLSVLHSGTSGPSVATSVLLSNTSLLFRNHSSFRVTMHGFQSTAGDCGHYILWPSLTGLSVSCPDILMCRPCKCQQELGQNINEHVYTAVKLKLTLPLFIDF